LKQSAVKEASKPIFNSLMGYSSPREGKHSNRYGANNLNPDDFYGAIADLSQEERMSIMSSNIGLESNAERKKEPNPEPKR
jgi:hypothetical protein